MVAPSSSSAVRERPRPIPSCAHQQADNHHERRLELRKETAFEEASPVSAARLVRLQHPLIITMTASCRPPDQGWITSQSQTRLIPDEEVRDHDLLLVDERV